MNLQRIGSSIVVVYDPTLDRSSVSKSPEEITLYVGRDIMYDKGRVETLGLRSLIAEVIASVILGDYQELTTAAPHNENAFYKLEIIKTLLNYRAYIPFYYRTCKRYAWTRENYWDERTVVEQRAIVSQCTADLDMYTRRWRRIGQYHIFVGVMDDADPIFLAHNYIHILLSRNPDISAEDITQIIHAVAQEPVLHRESMAQIRNVFKEFILNGVVRLRIVGTIQEKENFSNFDDTQRLRAIHDQLIDANTPAMFYDNMRRIIGLLLPPLDDEHLDGEMHRLIDSERYEGYSQLAAAEREGVVHNMLKELLVRRIGSTAYNTVLNHLTGNVKTLTEPPPEDIEVTTELPEEEETEEESAQFVTVLDAELEEGEDADDYRLAQATRDWVDALFKMHDERR
jgi:hypothetical protein